MRTRFIPVTKVVQVGSPLEPLPSNTDGNNGELVVVIPEGASDGTQTTTAQDSNLLAENIVDGVTIFGVEGTAENTPIAENTNGENGDLVVTIPAGVSDGTQTTTASDTNLVAGNIKDNITIFGVEGTYDPIETNLSISITGADEFVEGVATAYTIALDLTGFIGSPDTVVTATLPAGITYVSSSDSGSHNAGVVTWNLGTLMADKNLTLTINSETPATGYDVDVAVTSSIGNIGTATGSKEIEVTASGGGDIEIRLTGYSFNPFTETSGPTSVTALVIGGVNALPDFTQSILWLGGGVYRLGYLSSTVNAGTIDGFGGIEGSGIGDYSYWAPDSNFSYVKDNPTTIPMD